MLFSVLSQDTALSTMSLLQFMECTLASLTLGMGCALIYMFRNRYHKDFVVTLALLPVVVQLVIMLVNGNLGAGVAVMGAFSLVRFRSIPGTAKDIGSIFCAMAVGLSTGMGYLLTGVTFLICFGAASIVLTLSKFGENSKEPKQLRITIPENLDYDGIFDDLFEKYTRRYKLIEAKTTNMGSLFELTYTIEMKEISQEKELIDQLRCRNGNLKIVCGILPDHKEAI